MSSWQNVLEEAKSLVGDSHAMKDSTHVSVMKDEKSGEFFAVRASRVEALKAEGFKELLQIGPGGVTVGILNP